MNKPINKLTILALFAITGTMSYGMNQALGTSSVETKAEHAAASAELDQAIDIYTKGQFEEAKKQLWTVAKTSTNPDIKAEAFIVLGDIYYRGGGKIKIDYTQAKSCLDYALRITKKVHALAHGYLILGGIYANGDDKIKQDIKKAIDAFAHCIALNDDDIKLHALIELDKLTHKHTHATTHDYSQELQKVAAESLAKSIQLCKKGYGDAALRTLAPLAQLERYPALRARASIILGALFCQGDTTVEKNFSEAQRLLELALPLTKNRLFLAECYLLLGYLYAQGGHGIEKNVTQACIYFTRCTALNDRMRNPLAFLELGNLAYEYAQMHKNAPNYKTYLQAALTNFKLAAEQNHVPEARDKAKALMQELFPAFVS
jgi:TPR repeat protein